MNDVSQLRLGFLAEGFARPSADECGAILAELWWWRTRKWDREYRIANPRSQPEPADVCWGALARDTKPKRRTKGIK